MKTLTQKQQLINCKALLARMEGQLRDCSRKRTEDEIKVAEYSQKMLVPGAHGYNLAGLQEKIGWMQESQTRTYQLRLDIEELRKALGES